MISTLDDPEEPFTPELEQTATSVTGCLTNVLKSAAGSSQDNTESAVTLSSPEVKITSTVTSTTTTEISPFSIHSFYWSFVFRHQFRMGQFALSEQNSETDEGNEEEL